MSSLFEALDESYAGALACLTELTPGHTSPARRTEPGRSEAQQSIDALVSAAVRYRASTEYRRLLEFIRAFRSYSPFNGLLVDIQRPGSTFVAPAHRWHRQYGRTLRSDARPLAILQPFAPVMFVFDVADTEATQDAPPLPPEVTDPFTVVATPSTAEVERAIDRTLTNAIRDGVRAGDVGFGSQLAGRIGRARPDAGLQPFQVRARPEPRFEQVPVRYELEVSATQSGITRYATICHELAHLYCGHLGSPNDKWWSDRRYVDRDTAEFEAESVSSIAVWRLDPQAAMPPYLHQHLNEHDEVPDGMSLERITTVAKLLEDMASSRMPSRTASA
ncbi:MAG TPA: hypothetical protein VFT62_10320 [Mycobacteriales bacterium]|nr:hypothetical protein [Mycobacteriales bacterium]